MFAYCSDALNSLISSVTIWARVIVAWSGSEIIMLIRSMTEYSAMWCHSLISKLQ